jgi:DNA-binding CsgD family transcriptional regulator
MIPGLDVLPEMANDCAERSGASALIGSMSQMLAMSQHGLVWVDARLKVLSANPIALRILESADGVRVRDQRVCFARSETARDLVAFINQTPRTREALRPEPCSNGLLMRRIERPSGRTAYFLAIMRLAPTNGSPAALLLLEDLAAAPALHADVCKTVFGLTPAETRVAMRIVDGRSAPGIAQDLGLSTLTVRTHIKHIFKKIGVRSQSQLMSSLCRIAFLPVGSPAE